MSSGISSGGPSVWTASGAVLYAHSREGASETEWQPLAAHLIQVADRAAGFAAAFGAADWGRSLGLLHDAGKCQSDFQRRLHGESVRADHSTPGAQYAERTFHGLGRLLAYALAGHHAGLPDGDGAGDATLHKRLRRPVCDLTPLAGLLPTAAPAVPPWLLAARSGLGFRLSFFVRMLFSCLVDADYLDTEAFLETGRGALRTGWPDLAELERRFEPTLTRLRRAPDEGSGADTPLNRSRRVILEHCLAMADAGPGLFSLTVPTGGGKTLSSLAFALRHARRNGLERIIYVIPYTSIIEQNAAVFREALGADAVLEHHSTFDPGDESDEPSAAVLRARLAAENWDAPLVATTSVQFFESLFHHRPGKCRKLHNIARSVVILDEAQMLPERLLLPCLSALRELTANYGASVVLCTATQPALTRRAEFPQGLDAQTELAPDPAALFAAPEFRRTRVEALGTVTDEELADRLRRDGRALAVVNTRRHARRLFDRLRDAPGAHHLSALMCPAHRAAVLADIRDELKAGAPCLVVSTSLIEAGVDVDFPTVYRAACGLDSLAQAAGRCNREGRLSGPGAVRWFVPEEGVPSGEFSRAAEVGRGVLEKYPDPLAPDAVAAYFRELYWLAGERLDAKRILPAIEAEQSAGNFPFRTVSERFEFIPKGMRPVIILYDDTSRNLVEQLRYAEGVGGIARKLQRYVVQVRTPEWRQLYDAGGLETVREGFDVLIRKELYTPEAGLDLELARAWGPEDLIF